MASGIAQVLGFSMFLVWLVGMYNLGHFLAAHLLGFQTTNFSIGFGRLLGKFTIGYTHFELRAVPLGGFVKFREGESSLRFILLCCSGPLMNVVVALFLSCLVLKDGVEMIVPGGAVVAISE